MCPADECIGSGARNSAFGEGYEHVVLVGFSKAPSLTCIKLTHCMCIDIRNWIRIIEQHASDNVNKILVGNKADMAESKRVGSAGLGSIFLIHLLL